MKIITINLTESQLHALQVLQDYGIIPSRSEGIRRALAELLQEEEALYEVLNSDKFEQIIKESVVEHGK